MQPLIQRSPADGEQFHAVGKSRIYAEDEVQMPRIEIARNFVSKCIEREPVNIVELGCGTADISGPFAEKHNVFGFDCNSRSLEIAKYRFPKINAVPRLPFGGRPCEVVVLCEFLEHMANPENIVREWLPRADYCVISHPLNEAEDSQLSEGEHQWSFSQQDFENWFSIGGHALVEMVTFPMGNYTIIMGRGKRKN